MRRDKKLEVELDAAEVKAIDALARYKFTMFGYWSGIWVHLNRLRRGPPKANPFYPLVLTARGLLREEIPEETEEPQDPGGEA